jgi:hypothetical protein
VLCRVCSRPLNSNAVRAWVTPGAVQPADANDGSSQFLALTWRLQQWAACEGLTRLALAEACRLSCVSVLPCARRHPDSPGRPRLRGLGNARGALQHNDVCGGTALFSSTRSAADGLQWGHCRECRDSGCPLHLGCHCAALHQAFTRAATSFLVVLVDAWCSASSWRVGGWWQRVGLHDQLGACSPGAARGGEFMASTGGWCNGWGLRLVGVSVPPCTRRLPGKLHAFCGNLADAWTQCSTLTCMGGCRQLRSWSML